MKRKETLPYFLILLNSLFLYLLFIPHCFFFSIIIVFILIRFFILLHPCLHLYLSFIFVLCSSFSSFFNFCFPCIQMKSKTILLLYNRVVSQNNSNNELLLMNRHRPGPISTMSSWWLSILPVTLHSSKIKCHVHTLLFVYSQSPFLTQAQQHIVFLQDSRKGKI